MVTIFREPDHSYEDLVEMPEVMSEDIEELPALTAAIARPGERLWQHESNALVYRLWRKGRGKRTYWALDEENFIKAHERLSKELADTVLARLRRPGRCEEYAIVPGSEDNDLAAVEELDRIWLTGIRGLTSTPVDVDGAIRLRMRDIRAELARLKALRARNLQESYGEDATAHVAAALECSHADAHSVLGARERYERWIRAGAAHARDTIPVHRPPGSTGLPDDQAVRLMTAACWTETVLYDRMYPQPLPSDLAPWYVYIEARGHCIAVAVEGVYRPEGDPWEYMTIAPVKLVLAVGWAMQDSLVVSPVPYDMIIGAVLWDDGDNEF